MSELSHYYNEVACNAVWASYEACECGCGGSGYWLSQVDTWHQCPYHYVAGQGHPEDNDMGDIDVEWVLGVFFAYIGRLTTPCVEVSDTYDICF